MLDKLEAGRAATGGLAAGLDDLPLFAAAAIEEEEAVDALRSELGTLDIDSLSPRDALENPVPAQGPGGGRRMNAADLVDQFLAILLREAGGTRRPLAERDRPGQALQRPPRIRICNWSITPGGEAEENAAVERIADRLRERHPIID